MKCPKCGAKTPDFEPNCNCCGAVIQDKKMVVNEETECAEEKFLAFWQVLVFIFLPMLLIQYLLEPFYRFAAILGSAMGATLTTWLMSLIGFSIAKKLPLSINVKKLVGVVIGFVIYFTISFIVASL